MADVVVSITIPEGAQPRVAAMAVVLYAHLVPDPQTATIRELVEAGMKANLIHDVLKYESEVNSGDFTASWIPPEIITPE